MSWMTPERYATELISETTRLAGAVTRQDPGARVAACPEWTVRDLVTHVGTGHRLASGIIEERRDSPAPYELIDAPASPGEWTGWLTSGARRLTAAVDAHGFDRPVWTWQPKHQTAGFWLRRMLHDEIVHRMDAAPETAGDLAPDLAADGVADVLLCYERIGRVDGDGETLRFAATDTGDAWHVTLTPDGIAWEPGGRPADVTVSAPVAVLLMVLNRRCDPAAVDGDAALFERWRAGTEF